MTPRRSRATAGFALGLVVALGTSACGDADGEPKSLPSVPPGHTTPGTALAVGDTAVVSRTNGTGVIELTVTAIEEGTSADLQRIDFAEADTTTPYYVRYTMTLRSGDGYGVTMQNYLSAWTGDDQAGALAVAQRFPVCQEANFAPDAAPGATLESCRTYLVDAGDPPIDRVVFDNDTTYDAPEGEISWS